MDNIQKAIDDTRYLVNKNKGIDRIYLNGQIAFPKNGTIYVLSDNELKSLLEKMAKEAFNAGIKREWNWTEYPDFEDWWEHQNLTFNED